MEWGINGAERVSSGADYTVIIDVLSFTTTVSVALDSGIEVFPYPWRDATAQDFAWQHDALLAVGRSEAARGSGPQPLVSLSPASVRAATGLRRIVLPSPNGSALASHLARLGQNRPRCLPAQSHSGRPVVGGTVVGRTGADGTGAGGKGAG